MALSSFRFAVVMLAGGRGERAGQAKGLIRVAGEPWLLHQERVVSHVTPFPTIVVVGIHAEAYAAHFGSQQGLAFARNPEPDLGPFSSLQIGIATAFERHPNLDGVFVLPVDTSAPVLSVWEGLASAVVGGADAAIPTRGASMVAGWENIDLKPGRSGHPVALSPGFCRRILTLNPRDSGSRLDMMLACLRSGEKIYLETEDARPFVNLNNAWDWELMAPLVIPDLKDSAIAIPRRRAAAVCLSERGLLAIAAREPVSRKRSLFPPGGAIEPGEEAADAARREVFEETGLSLKIDASKIVIAYQLTPWNGKVYSSVTHYFGATLAPDGHREFMPDDPVIEALEWVPLDGVEAAFGFLPLTCRAVKMLIPA